MRTPGELGGIDWGSASLDEGNLAEGDRFYAEAWDLATYQLGRNFIRRPFEHLRLLALEGHIDLLDLGGGAEGLDHDRLPVLHRHRFEARA